MSPGDVDLLRCPDCRGTLRWAGREREGFLDTGRLSCGTCGAVWPVRDGLPRLVREARVTGTDRLMCLVYDRFAALHDPAVRYLLPRLEGRGSERAIRDAYLRRIALASLTDEVGGRPARILEVGVGTGANLPLLRRDLPEGARAEVWGLDLSHGMMERCRRRAASTDLGRVRLLFADAHVLPFPDATFDRVFHVGGLNAFRDRGLALSEMARVARPGTPIVVVDEQLDPALRRSPFHRAAFSLLTLLERDPRSPRDLLPPGAQVLHDEQVSPFYYCLTFRVPAA